MDTCHTLGRNLSSRPTPCGSHSRNGSFNKKSCSGTVPHACSSYETPGKTPNLADSNARPIVQLKIYKTPKSPAQWPVFNEGEEIAGSAELNLVKPDNVEEIVLSIRGTINGLAGHPRRFVEVTERLWEASQVEQNACPNSLIGGKPAATLKGYFNWPFSLKLPSHITAIDAPPCNLNRNKFTGQLPPSFSVTESRSSITYEVCVNMKGRHNFTLSSPFIYIPTVRPPCLLSPRGVACNHAVDDDQWHVFHSCNIRGIAFAAYNTDVSCTFALPKPLHYTSGTSIPCALGIECADENILELLGSPRAPCIQLSRHVEDSSSGLETKIARLWDAIKNPSTFISSAMWSVVDNPADQDDEVAAAVRAVKSNLRGGMHSKVLVGRIPLSPDLTPSFSFAKLSIKYEVQMLPFKAAGFVPEDGERAIFFRTNIQIASAPPIPISSRPSSAASLSRPGSLHRRALPMQASPSSLHRDTSPHSRNSNERIDLDRPLPCLPRFAGDEKKQQRDADNSDCIHRPERISSSEHASGLECTILRRVVTAPRSGPSPCVVPTRSAFPSRQCTR